MANKQAERTAKGGSPPGPELIVVAPINRGTSLLTTSLCRKTTAACNRFREKLTAYLFTSTPITPSNSRNGKGTAASEDSWIEAGRLS